MAGVKHVWRPREHRTYFVQGIFGGPIKIGITSGSVEARVAAMQTGSPVELRTLAVLDGNHERELHRRFAKWRLHGEWFDSAAPGLRDVIVDAGAGVQPVVEDDNDTQMDGLERIAA
jgi:hypothetical protein